MIVNVSGPVPAVVVAGAMEDTVGGVTKGVVLPPLPELEGPPEQPETSRDTKRQTESEDVAAVVNRM